jgi:hypothetical protein
MAEQVRHQRAVGVYATADQAREAVERIRATGDDAVRVDDPDDHAAALRGEMREEVSRTFFAPHAGLLVTKESGRGMGVSIATFGVVFALLALPLAAIGMGGLPALARVGIVMLTGALAGATVGFVVGNALGSRGPATPNAADDGVVVAVDDPTDAELEAMIASKPTRLDVVDESGTPVETITTSDAREDEGSFDRLGHNLRQPPGGEPSDWADTEP